MGVVSNIADPSAKLKKDMFTSLVEVVNTYMIPYPPPKNNACNRAHFPHIPVTMLSFVLCHAI